MEVHSCFRREAGSWGKDVRGLNRLHQFDKVELCPVGSAKQEYGRSRGTSRSCRGNFTKLNLPYRTLLMCTGDMGFPHAKQYDLEVWAGGQKRWLEVSSCSCFTDFQARRATIRYRDADGKASPVHTLNGSGLAVPRVLAAILENYYQPDGRVKVPEVLQHWFNKEYLEGLSPEMMDDRHGLIPRSALEPSALDKLDSSQSKIGQLPVLGGQILSCWFEFFWISFPKSSLP